MHIAICFWGICRSTDKTIESIKKCIYEPLTKAGYTYDIYVHTYSLSSPLTNPRANEYNIILNNELYKLLMPNHAKVDEQATIDKSLNIPLYQTQADPWSNNYDTHTNHLRALYSLMQVTSMWSEKSYDRIIYARPDVNFLVPINLDWLNENENTILLPNFHKYPVNDRFALGWPNAMKIYGSRFNNALEFSKIHPLHAEKYLNNILNSNNIIVKTIAFNFYRVRADGKLCSWDPQS